MNRPKIEVGLPAGTTRGRNIMTEAHRQNLSEGSRDVGLKEVSAYLKEMDVPFELFLCQQPWFYTHAELASCIGIPVRAMAKVIVLKAGTSLVLGIVPAQASIDLGRAKQVLQIRKVQLATEGEVRQRFHGCDVNSIPPFGTLFNLPMVLDLSMVQNEQIAFPVENHHQAIKLRLPDFLKLQSPWVGEIRCQPLRMGSGVS